MTITIASAAEAPGQGGKALVRTAGASPGKIGYYTVTLDADQATGGEDISDIWDDFKSVIAIVPVNTTGTIANLRFFTVDTTNKTLIALKTISAGANAEEVDSLDTIVVTLVVFGT